MKYLLLVLLTCCTFLHAQDPLRFESEVLSIQQRYDSIWDATRETVVFTGSSSIRLWENLADVFPGHQIVNSGFGGSHASDLLHFSKELILDFNPKKVFIYEGDNDIFSKKKPKQILSTLQEIVTRIRKENGNAQIVLIGAKPSISRWNLKRKYKRLNRKMEKLCKQHSWMRYANVWDIMISGRKPKQDIFIGDALHMNSKGYDLWYTVINNFIK